MQGQEGYMYTDYSYKLQMLLISQDIAEEGIS